MTAPARPGFGAVVVGVILALTAGTGLAGATQIDDKRAEAASITAKLDDQARSIVELDKEHRRALDRLADADTAVARAQLDLAAAERRQDQARSMLAVHAREAYVSGGSISFLGSMARGTVADAGARRTYLNVAANDDRAALDRLRAAREDLQARRQALTDARKAASDREVATATDVARLEKAMAAQRGLLVTVNGELTQLVAAEQARRDADAARLAAARVPVAPAPTPVAAAAAAAPATLPALLAPVTAAVGGSLDATFACIRQLESGNNYKAPGGGAYQFQDATWHSLGYSGTASDAPPAVQDEAARKLQARDGWAPWTTAGLCGRV